MSIDVKQGQIWKDHDRRRTEHGNVRTIRIDSVSGDHCRGTVTDGPNKGKVLAFRVRRFKPSANDGFELVGK